MKKFYHQFISYFPIFTLFIFLLWSLCPPIAPAYLHDFFEYDQKRLLEIALFYITGFSLLMSPRLLKQVFANFMQMSGIVRYGMPIFFLFGIISSLLSSAPVPGLIDCAAFMALFVYVLYWNAIGQEVGEKIFYITAQLLFISISVYFCFVFSGYTSYLAGSGLLNLFPFFVQKRHFTRFIVFVIPLLPVLMMYLKKDLKSYLLHALFFLFSICCWLLLIYNASRGVYIALLLSSLICLFYFKSHALGWLKYQLTYFALALLLYGVFSMLAPDGNKLYQATHHLVGGQFQDRIQLYTTAIKLAVKHPFLGVGPMSFALYHEAGNPKPHCLVLMLLAEWGIPATALVLYLFFNRIRAFISSLRSFIFSEANESLGLMTVSNVASLFAGLVYSLVSSVMISPLSQIMFAVVLANCLTLSNIAKSSCADAVEIKPKKLLAIIILMIGILFPLTIFSVKVLPQAPNLMNNEVLWLSKQEKMIYYPRFWAQGWL